MTLSANEQMLLTVVKSLPESLKESVVFLGPKNSNAIFRANK